MFLLINLTNNERQLKPSESYSGGDLYNICQSQDHWREVLKGKYLPFNLIVYLI